MASFCNDTYTDSGLCHENCDTKPSTESSPAVVADCVKEFVEIPVFPNGTAIIDQSDFSLISQFQWRTFQREKITYAVTGRATLMHRLILGAEKGDGQRIDHKSGNGLDCRRDNLRFATQSQNRANSRKHIAGASKFKGVMASHSGKWRVYCGPRDNRSYLGQFIDEIEAALAYDRKAVEVYGEFACLNFPDRRPA